MTKIEQVLYEVKELRRFLYGTDGFDGDIPEIKKKLDGLNGISRQHDRDIATLKVKVKRNWQLIATALGGSGSLAVGITKLLHLW